MIKIGIVLAGAALIVGCSKVDKDICWKQETKDSIEALVLSQGDAIKPQVTKFFEMKNVQVYFGAVDLKLKESDFRLDKIDSESETVDCSFTLNVKTTFNSSAVLQGSGRVRFSSKNGENGRYIDLNKSDIPPIAIDLK